MNPNAFIVLTVDIYDIIIIVRYSGYNIGTIKDFIGSIRECYDHIIISKQFITW